MVLSDFLATGAVVPVLKATSKKQALLELAERASDLTALPGRAIFDALLQRERLGSTGVGNGVAIPHGRMAGLSCLFGLFARLDRPIAFESIDGHPVDLIFVLLAPEGAGADHLRALSRIARLLRDPGTVQRLRGTRDASALHSLLCGEPAKSNAA